MERGKLRRRELLWVAVVMTFWTGHARADEVAVPISLQAQLLAKTASYDRNFEARAGDEALVLVVFKQGNSESEQTSANLMAELKAQPSIGGKAHREASLKWTGPNELRQAVRSQHAAVVYLAAGFDSDIPAIAKALDGVDVLSATVNAQSVEKGVVLGFDLVSGKPKILIHLPQSRRQNVAFKAEILKIAKVYN